MHTLTCFPPRAHPAGPRLHPGASSNRVHHALREPTILPGQRGLEGAPYLHTQRPAPHVQVRRPLLLLLPPLQLLPSFPALLAATECMQHAAPPSPRSLLNRLLLPPRSWMVARILLFLKFFHHVAAHLHEFHLVRLQCPCVLPSCSLLSCTRCLLSATQHAPCFRVHAAWLLCFHHVADPLLELHLVGGAPPSIYNQKRFSVVSRTTPKKPTAGGPGYIPPDNTHPSIHPSVLG